MKILSITQNYQQPSFGNKAATLPPSFWTSVPRKVYRVMEGNKCDNVYQAHLKTYEQLAECSSLEDAQKLFPEFKNVKNLSEYSGKKISGLKPILDGKAPMFNPKTFSLDLLKSIYLHLNQQDIFVKLRFIDVPDVKRLLEGLNIKFLPAKYYQGLKQFQIRDI